ncbi:hypothetical protein Tco_1148211 [Tanacetum coccineum]
MHINESAFIIGRHIQDNILIAQELLRGYNRKNGPKRCAMQIDIQKAYDTVSWSFLEEILGGRGLRQGDPISPYLFTLVMEVFSLIMEKNIEESNEFGNKGSIEVAKKSLEEFNHVSGLVPNLGKSLIFFGSINDRDKMELLQVLPFKCGRLPVKYLGVPLLAKKLGVSDCQILIDRESIIREIKSYLMQEESKSLPIMLVILPKEKQELLGKWFADQKSKTSVWYDKWCTNGPLSNVISRREIYDARLDVDAKVADLVNNGKWNWPDGWKEKFLIIGNLDKTVSLSDKEDKVLWITNDGEKIQYEIEFANHYNLEVPCILEFLWGKWFGCAMHDVWNSEWWKMTLMTGHTLQTEYSSCESEFMAATGAACQALWLKRLLSELTGWEEKRITLKVDNVSAIALVRNPVFHGRSKHIDIRYHFIRECVENGHINVEHVRGELQRADILTKALPRLKFVTMRQMLGVQDLGRSNDQD